METGFDIKESSTPTHPTDWVCILFRPAPPGPQLLPDNTGFSTTTLLRQPQSCYNIRGK